MSQSVSAGAGRFSSIRQRPNKSKNKNERKKNYHHQVNYNHSNSQTESLPPPPSYDDSSYSYSYSAPLAYVEDRREQDVPPRAPGGPMYFNPNYNNKDAIEHEIVRVQAPLSDENINAAREKRSHPCTNLPKGMFFWGGIAALSILGLGGVYLTSQENNFSAPINKTDIVDWPIQQNESLPVYSINSTQDNVNLTQKIEIPTSNLTLNATKTNHNLTKIETPTSNTTVNISKTNTTNSNKVDKKRSTSIQKLLEPCRPLTKNFIKTYITVGASLDQKKMKDTLAQKILEAGKYNSELEEIMRMVFKYYPELKIHIENLDNEIQYPMTYIHPDKTIYIKANNLNEISSSDIIWCFPLVFWNILHRFSDPKTMNYYPWFNDNQINKILTSLELGVQRFNLDKKLISNLSNKCKIDPNNIELSKSQEIINKLIKNLYLDNPIKRRSLELQYNYNFESINQAILGEIISGLKEIKIVVQSFENPSSQEDNKISSIRHLLYGMQNNYTLIKNFYFKEFFSTMDEILQNIPLK